MRIEPAAQYILSLVPKIRRTESYPYCVELSAEAVNGEDSIGVDFIIFEEFICSFDGSTELIASLSFF